MESFLHIIENYGIWSIVLLICFSFLAGFIDSIVGGGGLIIVPYLLIAYPGLPLPVLFGTNKFSSLSGTSVSAYLYSKRVKFDAGLLAIISVFSLISAYFGAQLLRHLDSGKIKPFILVILVVIAVYTFIKKDFGSFQKKEVGKNWQYVLGSLMAVIVGFYDGFFGPGTGSFFVLGFILLLGFDFLYASAYSKVVNCVTNVSALFVFISNGQFILLMAVLMALFNMTGSVIGSRLALKKGNQFIRKFYLLVVSLLILKFAYDLFVE